MKRKILAIFMVLLFFGAGLVFPSYAVTIEKKSNDTEDTNLDNSAPVINSIEYYGCRRSGFGYKVSFLVKASDPDGDDIFITYRKSEFDTWWNYIYVLPTPACYIIDWNVKRGSYTAHFKACDYSATSEDVAITFNVPKPKAREFDNIFLLQDILNLNIFKRFF